MMTTMVAVDNGDHHNEEDKDYGNDPHCMVDWSKAHDIYHYLHSYADEKGEEDKDFVGNYYGVVNEDL